MTCYWPPRPPDHTIDKTGAPDEPWLTRDAITFLGEKVHDGMRVLEYGSGASTIWFAKRAAQVDAIEHDYSWYQRVACAISNDRIQNAMIHSISDANDFEDYVQLGRRLCIGRDGFDLIVVDGRRRVRCIKAVAEFVRPGGMIVLDNAERPHYQEAQDFLSSWFVKRTSNGLWRTDLFRKA